jgi:glycosyltransferase involved in cell wall biosynthesis
LKKVLLLNDYNLDDDQIRHAEGRLPNHLIFGLDKFLDFNLEFTSVRLWEPGILYELDNFFIRHKPHIPIGRLETQFKALRKLNGVDAILSLKETESSLLHYLRAIGYLKIPIVTLVHHSQDIGRFNKWKSPIFKFLNQGSDAILSFSEKVVILSERKKRKVIRWGPDLEYYSRLNPTFGNQIMTSGRSGRDFGTFAEACMECKAHAKIMCLDYDVSPVFKTVNPFVKFEIGLQSQDQICRKLKEALAIAIPMQDQEFTCGLTSFCDPLGLGKAVLMPENIGIDIDVEGLGIGKIIKPNNKDGWSKAISWVQKNKEKTKEMGKQARHFAEANYNSKIFVSQVSEVLHHVIAKNEVTCR